MEPYLIKRMYIDTHNIIRSWTQAEIDWEQHLFLHLFMNVQMQMSSEKI